MAGRGIFQAPGRWWWPLALVLGQGDARAQAPARAPSSAAQAVPAQAPDAPSAGPTSEPHWYERLSIRGYLQGRYNHLGHDIGRGVGTNEALINDQGDRSLGGKGGFFLRRARLILFGDVHERVYVYLQPDFASSAGDTQYVAQLRDAYVDVSLDRRRELRVRLGQSKVPYGFENMQSSQNRLSLDRNDALNSAVPNERDLGVFVMWAPAPIRERFRYLVASGLKGSGDYGVVALGVYNGQGTNQLDRNANRHVVARLTWPFDLGGQFLEASVGAYTGRYQVNADKTVLVPERDVRDARWHVTLVKYPQPLGFQAEYTQGVGPQLVGPVTGGTLSEQPLFGGYAQVMLRVGSLIPFVRVQRYRGGKKFVTNAPRYEVDDIEGGVEWQPWRALELTGTYLIARRTSDRAPYDLQEGRALRLQAQVNF